MPCRPRRSSPAATLALCLTAATLGMVVPPRRAAAQVPVATPTDSPVATRRTRPLSEVLTAMNRALGTAGISLVADSAVAPLLVVPPGEPTTPDNAESQLAALAKALPAGTVWAKLYLPVPPNRRGYNGDAVADYALAEARLFGPVGGATAPGTVEIMGRKLSTEQARPHIDGLGLQPVYILSNPNARADATGFGLNRDTTQWQAMTAEQRRDYAQNQAQSLLSMDPAARNALMQQNMLIFSNFMRQLPPDQQQGVFQGMMGPGGGNVTIRVKTLPGDGSGGGNPPATP